MLAVSVIIPAFNAPKTIAAALGSVEAQTFQDFEIIVIDDGSTDGTFETARRAAPRATVVRQANGGPAAARNAGISMARGRLVSFLDADDLWFPRAASAETVSELAQRAKAAWARLIGKVYEADPLQCPKCKGPTRVPSGRHPAHPRAPGTVGTRGPGARPARAGLEWPANAVIPLTYHPLPDIA